MRLEVVERVNQEVDELQSKDRQIVALLVLEVTQQGRYRCGTSEVEVLEGQVLQIEGMPACHFLEDFRIEHEAEGSSEGQRKLIVCESSHCLDVGLGLVVLDGKHNILGLVLDKEVLPWLSVRVPVLVPIEWYRSQATEFDD